MVGTNDATITSTTITTLEITNALRRTRALYSRPIISRMLRPLLPRAAVKPKSVGFTLFAALTSCSGFFGFGLRLNIYFSPFILQKIQTTPSILQLEYLLPVLCHLYREHHLPTR